MKRLIIVLLTGPREVQQWLVHRSRNIPVLQELRSKEQCGGNGGGTVTRKEGICSGD